MAELPTLRSVKEAFPVAYRLRLTEQEAAHLEERYQRERRDGLTARIRGSLVALHGASLVALLGLIGGDASGARWLGIGREPLALSAVLFILGLLGAGWSLTAEQTLAIEDSGDALSRAGHLDRITALFENTFTPQNHAQLEKAEKEFESAPLSGFKYSMWAIAAQHLSGAAWLLGVIIPIAVTLF